MDHRLVGLALDTVGLIPAPCRSCVNWEIGPQAGASAAGQADFEKEVWLSGILLQWGSCGQLLMVDEEVVGYALYAPPSAVPVAQAFPTGPVSPDAVLLLTAHVLPGHAGKGWGRRLVQGVAGELSRRGVKAIELFGRTGPEPLPAEVPGCLVPTEFAEAVGFTPVRPHHRLPRLRLEVDQALGWKADVEAALERLFTEITLSTAAEPELVGAGASSALSVRSARASLTGPAAAPGRVSRCAGRPAAG